MQKAESWVVLHRAVNERTTFADDEGGGETGTEEYDEGGGDASIGDGLGLS